MCCVLQAERQAVNTTVQGSGADLVKKAMVLIDNELQRVFPQSSIPHLSKQGIITCFILRYKCEIFSGLKPLDNPYSVGVDLPKFYFWSKS